MPPGQRAPRVLMIAHGFPPAGGSGSNRALAFARYLPSFGWRPIVLTPGARWAANRDDALLHEVPTKLTLVRTRSLEPVHASAAPPSAQRSRPPGRLRRQLGHLKRFPDAHIGWLPYAVAAARRHEFDVIYSSSGPFTSHLIGLALHALSRKPFVAELRDGWYRWNRAIFPDYPAWRDPLERNLEAAVIRSSSRIVLVNERMARAFRCQYPRLPAAHFAVISNGFDAAQITYSLEAPTEPPAHFELLHTGALYYGRSLAAFLDAAAQVIRAEPAIGSTLRVTLIGTLDSTAQQELAGHALGDRIRFLGYQDHAATLSAMRRADLLLLVANTTPGAEATVPGKLFEYLAVGRPVLAIAPADSASADIIAETHGGWLAPAGDPMAIAEALRAAYCARTLGQQHRPDARAVARYERRLLSGQLAALFDDVLAARRV